MIVLSGEGCMREPRMKGEAKVGDAIFRRRNEFHRLEAMSVDGNDVVGAIWSWRQSEYQLLRLTEVVVSMACGNGNA